MYSLRVFKINLINLLRAGNSGIRVGIAGSGEPVWTDFGEMYADFVYTDDVGGSLEVKIALCDSIRSFCHPLNIQITVKNNSEDIPLRCRRIFLWLLQLVKCQLFSDATMLSQRILSLNRCFWSEVQGSWPTDSLRRILCCFHGAFRASTVKRWPFHVQQREMVSQTKALFIDVGLLQW